MCGAHMSSAVDHERLAHCALEVQTLDVVPILLEQRDEEVDRRQTVLPQLIRVHANVANGHTHAKHLLQLKLYLAPDIVDLHLKVVSMLNECWELASFVETRTQQPGNLRDEHLRGNEGIKGLCQLLDELLVLVELFQALHTLEWDV